MKDSLFAAFVKPSKAQSTNFRKVLTFLLVAAAQAGLVVYRGMGSEQADADAAPIYAVKLPLGYRDWKLISVARVGGNLNDLRAKLGNDVAIKAYREGKLPFPDGTIIARLAFRAVTSEENNTAFRAAAERQGLSPEQITKFLSESFVAGPAVNVQFMIKDSKKYTSTGGWGFAQFTNGKPDNEAVHKTCFSCHEPAKDRDFVFTHYAP